MAGTGRIPIEVFIDLAPPMLSGIMPVVRAPDQGPTVILVYEAEGIQVLPTATTEFQRDVRGYEVSGTIILNNGQIVKLIYKVDADGRYSTKTDTQDRVTQYQYDQQNRFVEVTRPAVDSPPVEQIPGTTYITRGSDGTITSMVYDGKPICLGRYAHWLGTSWSRRLVVQSCDPHWRVTGRKWALLLILLPRS